MRDLALDEPAALVYCPFRSLQHLPTWADRRRTFERVAASLMPEGRFPGTPSPSTITSPRASMAGARSPGLSWEALYGGFGREPFTEDNREYVFIARRPALGFGAGQVVGGGTRAVACERTRGALDPTRCK
ncbi:hypothetical protein [Nonomuraea sp. NPDC049400]|uniref:hypothetical protein n=1 Tax=Nonomuraea sp. NPDC049400 TaxID=3364352 RepID=UPI0037B14009